MREFVVLAHEAPLSPDVPLDDLPGGAGRLDLLCRCVTAGLLCSHDIRDETTVTVIIQDQLTIRFAGGEITQLHPDERSTAARFRDALETAKDAVGKRAVSVSPGITVSRQDLDDTLDRVQSEERSLVLLHEAGSPLPSLAPPTDPVFVLSDHRSFSYDERERLQSVATATIRVGPVPIHTDHTITVAHNYLDTSGYRQYD